MSDPELRRILEQTHVIAVVGAHPDPTRAASYVPAYLRSQGYRVLPVNPRYVGRELFGEPVRATLADLEEPVDLVDVFRRSSAVPEHLADILALDPRPSVVWLQLGIRNEPVAARLRAEGITVVQNRCTLADHQRLVR